MAPKPKRKKYRLKPRFFLFIIFLTAFFWVFGHWAAGAINKAMLKTIVAKEGEIEWVTDMETVIAKDEVIVSSVAAGLVKPLFKEGQKVRNDVPIFQIASEEIARERELKLKVNAEKRAKLDAEWTEAQEKYQAEILKFDQQARECIQAISSTEKNSDAETNKLEKELNELLVKSQAVEQQSIKAEVEYKKKVKRLEEEKSHIEAEYLASVQSQKAPMAGIISYKIDGYEMLYDDAYLQALTPEMIAKIEEKIPPKQNVVQAGQPVAKIVDNQYVKFIGILPKKQLENLSTNQDIRVAFPEYEGKEIKANLIGYGKADSTSQVVFFQSDDWLPEFASCRKTNAKVVFGRYRGIVLPKECLVKKVGQTGVYVLKKEQPVFVPIDIIGENKDKMAVKGIDVGMQVILNPQRVKN